MSFVWSEHSANLMVANQAADENAVRRAVKRLEPGLMLTREFDEEHRGIVYVVRHWLGSGVTPLEVLRWRDPDGHPKPLSFALVDELQRQEARGRELYTEAEESNRKRREAEHRRLDAELEEFAREHGNAGSGLRSACLPRGQHLRIARDKRRARGEAA